MFWKWSKVSSSSSSYCIQFFAPIIWFIFFFKFLNLIYLDVSWIFIGISLLCPLDVHVVWYELCWWFTHFHIFLSLFYRCSDSNYVNWCMFSFYSFIKSVLMFFYIWCFSDMLLTFLFDCGCSLMERSDRLHLRTWVVLLPILC